jgi:bidirectional [NiFe] hydrogenase diaphorase subunit
LFGFLQADLLMYIARQLRLPPSRVYGSEVGACRLCLVEIEGSNKLVPSCLTAVAEGMNVTTNAPRLRDYRKMIVELRFAERNHVCSVCVANGHC